MEPIIYKITGGITHLLGGLRTCILAAKSTGRDVWIDRSYNYTSFPFSLSEFFDFSTVGVSVEDVVLPLDHPCYGGAAFIEDTSEVGLYAGGKIGSKSQSWSGFDITTEHRIEHRGAIRATPQISHDDWKHPHVWHAGGCHNGLPEKIKLQKQVKDECLLQVPQEPYICLHYRNTDIKTSPRLLYEFVEELNRSSRCLDKKLQPTMPIFLCTDHLASVQEIKNELHNYDVRCINEPPEVGHNLHYGHPDKRKQILTALKDMCIMRYAEAFFPGKLGKSGVSQWVHLMRINQDHDLFFDHKLE